MADNQNNLPAETPNVVIEDPKTRKRLNTVLSILLLVVGLVSLFWAFFPEAGLEGDLETRITNFIITAITLVSAWFGLGVTNRNYPKF